MTKRDEFNNDLNALLKKYSLKAYIFSFLVKDKVLIKELAVDDDDYKEGDTYFMQFNVQYIKGLEERIRELEKKEASGAITE